MGKVLKYVRYQLASENTRVYMISFPLGWIQIPQQGLVWRKPEGRLVSFNKPLMHFSFIRPRHRKYPYMYISPRRKNKYYLCVCLQGICGPFQITLVLYAKTQKQLRLEGKLKLTICLLWVQVKTSPSQDLPNQNVSEFTKTPPINYFYKSTETWSYY